MSERNEKRIAGYGDPVAALDSSAQVIYDPDWWKKPFLGFGHDYHTIAAGFAGFDGDGSGLNHGDRPGGTDPNCRGGGAVPTQQEETTNQFTPFSLDEPDDTKMTAMTE